MNRNQELFLNLLQEQMDIIQPLVLPSNLKNLSNEDSDFLKNHLYEIFAKTEKVKTYNHTPNLEEISKELNKARELDEKFNNELDDNVVHVNFGVKK